MSFWGYLKDKLFFILAEGLAIAFTAVMTAALGLSAYAVFFISLVLVLANAAVFVSEYMKRRAYYERVISTFDGLDQKYLIAELIEPGDFMDAQIMYEILCGANKSMNDRIALFKSLSTEYREYIESWVHEIKTPIAAARLALENHPGAISKAVEDDLSRVEALVMNVLYYARSNDVEKDYIIKRVGVGELISAALKRNSRRLIENRMAVSMEEPDIFVYTDEKWLAFILDQIITNSIKYRTGDTGRLEFRCAEDGAGASLTVTDAGIGIPRGDITRVFEKGFTGENGRRYASSTGMGLYLVKKLCDKLGIGARALPADAGAVIEIYFPKSDMHIMEKHFGRPKMPQA